jgi:DNA transformation protein
MAVSDGFLSFVLEQLESLGDVTPRRMFGGAGLYAGAIFFAVLDNDTLFFKVDEATIGEYVEAGMPPFQPYPGKPETSFGYYQVPVRVLEDRDELAVWARRAVDVGRTTRRPPRRRRVATGRGRRNRSAR